MGLVFEEFVAGFIDMEYPRAHRATREMSWSATAMSCDQISWLPQMRMDIPLDWPSHRTIVECKFYRAPWAEHYGKRSLHSGHVYQLYSYLENDFRQRGERAHGVLLYAANEEPARLDFTLNGYPFSVRTVNLNQTWEAIDRELRALLGEWERASVSPMLAGGGVLGGRY